MRDFRDAKAMAQTLRDALKTRSVSLTHSESLELIARTLGFADWNVLAAKIQSSQPALAAAEPSNPALPALPVGAGIPILALRDVVLFPHMVIPIFVGREKSRRAVERAMATNGRILALTQRRAADDDPALDALHPVGVTANVIHRLTLIDGNLKIFLSGIERATIARLIHDDFLAAEIAPVHEVRGQSAEAEALSRNVFDAYQVYAKIELPSPSGSRALFDLPNIDGSSMLADSIAALLPIDLDKKQKLLEAIDVIARLETILDFMKASQEPA